MTTAALRFPRILAAEAKGEILKIVRLPAYLIPTIVFPAMFYIIFGLSLNHGNLPGTNISVATYMIATYGAFGVIGAGMFGLGVGVAVERAQGWLTLKRASPMPPLAYFGGKVILCTLMGLLVTVLLGTLGVLFGDVNLSVGTWLKIAAVLALGGVPFCVIGCAIAYMVGPNSAPAVVNLIYLPMSFASGLWVPIEMMPKLVKTIAPALPPYQLSRLALGVIGADKSSPWPHAAVLLGYMIVFMIIAVIAYRRDDGRTFG
ncbi:MAG TPA: ABC transporter permease [Longimicrobiales bacterium]|nr:ABC transporter permease [Longimicrobiales bacterium]